MKTKLMVYLTLDFNLISFLFVGLILAAFPPFVSAQTARHQSVFNHMQTGFPLTGIHTNVECETCHVGGIFKGTPTNCAGCHSVGRRVSASFKPANHLVTNDPCEICHTNTVSFLGARFNHFGVQPSACKTCHNSGVAPGKPAGHVLTVSSCDTCHRTSSWIPAGYDHAGKFIGDHSCPTCHGVTAIGKPSFHITTTAACDTCHKNFSTFYGAAFDHAGVASGCVNCHGGQSLEIKSKNSINHIPTSLDCNICHASTTSFSIEIMAHLEATPCKTCHDIGSSYAGRMRKIALTHKQADVGVVAVDCSQSSCHKPVGSIGTTYSAWTN